MKKKFTKRDSEIAAYNRGLVQGMPGYLELATNYKPNGRLDRHYKNGILARKKSSERTQVEGS